MNTTAMWEILVPTEKRLRTPAPGEGANLDALKAWQRSNSYSTRYHRVWDEKVRKLTNGLTIMTPVKGQWSAPDGELFKERMIPVRIVATREQIEAVIDMTLKYYDQLAVLCYKISDEVIIKHRGPL
jgi:hypothetical protein